MAIMVTEKRFEEVFKKKLGYNYSRALAVFTNYGIILSPIMATIFLRASELGKVGEVLVQLERHWEEDLQFQSPEVRGKIHDRIFGINETRLLLYNIYKKTLKLRPALSCRRW